MLFLYNCNGLGVLLHNYNALSVVIAYYYGGLSVVLVKLQHVIGYHPNTVVFKFYHSGLIVFADSS